MLWPLVCASMRELGDNIRHILKKYSCAVHLSFTLLIDSKWATCAALAPIQCFIQRGLLLEKRNKCEP